MAAFKGYHAVGIWMIIYSSYHGHSRGRKLSGRRSGVFLFVMLGLGLGLRLIAAFLDDFCGDLESSGSVKLA